MKNLLAYAYLMADFDRGARTPQQVLEGVVIRSFARSDGAKSAAGISEEILKDWGLSIPIGVIRHSLRSLQARKIVEHHLNESEQQEIFRGNISKEDKENFKREEDEARSKYDRIKTKVVAELFRENLQDSYSGDDIIEKWLDGSAISFLGSDLSASVQAFEGLEVNRIIAKVLGLGGVRDDEALSDLTDLAVGDVLYRSLREITEHEFDLEEEFENSHIFRAVNVFLDVGIIARAFGYYGDEQQIAIKQMLAMIKEVGYVANVFQHTVDELQEVIGAAAVRVQAGKSEFKGPMISYAVRTGKSASDLMQESANVRRNCENIGLNVVERPMHEVDMTIDELALEHDLKVYVKQENPRARQRDVDSLTSIFTFRRGEPKRTIDTCGAIFITHNRVLQSAAHHFFKEHFSGNSTKNIVQLCMTDAVFSFRLWVKLPTTINWKPRAQIIACALSNLVPAPGIREAFLNRLKQLVESKKIDSNMATLVEFSQFTQEILALDYSQGDHISEDDAKSVVKNAIQMMSTAISDARRAGFRLGIKEQADALNDFVSNNKLIDEENQLKIKELEHAISRSERDLEISGKLSYLAAKAIVGLLFLILAGGTLLTLLISFEIGKTWISLTVSGISVIILFVMAWFGLDRLKILKSTVSGVESWLMRRLARLDPEE